MTTSFCPQCGGNVNRVALAELVFTWRPILSELVETPWHKECYFSYLLSAQPQNALDPATPEVSNAANETPGK